MGFMSEALYESFNFSGLFPLLRAIGFGLKLSSIKPWPKVKSLRSKNRCFVRSGFAKNQKAGFCVKPLKLILEITFHIKVQVNTGTAQVSSSRYCEL